MPTLVYKFQEQEHRFLLKDRTAIGRHRDNDLCVPSESISSQHAVIKRDGNGYQLEDAGSSNGIVVGGRRVLSCPLQSGAVFALGDVEFAFALDASESVGADAKIPSLAKSEEVIAQFKDARDRVLAEIGKVIVGQHDVLDDSQAQAGAAGVA